MSEITQCNYCSLRWIRDAARREGCVVTLKPGGIGTAVFVHKQGEALLPWKRRRSLRPVEPGL